LFGRIDGGVRTGAAAPVQLVNVGSDLVESDAANLARSVGEYDDVFGHFAFSGRSRMTAPKRKNAIN
jgi:hypothetical protein